MSSLQPAGSDLPSSQKTILVVDDDQDMIRILKIAVEQKFGHKCLTAQNGLEAVAVVKNYDGPIHAIVTDIEMPQSDGVQFARFVRESNKDMLIIFLSAAFVDESTGVIGSTGYSLKDLGVLKPSYFFEKTGMKTLASIEAVLVTN